jgi:hypothetical protein
MMEEQLHFFKKRIANPPIISNTEMKTGKNVPTGGNPVNIPKMSVTSATMKSFLFFVFFFIFT